MDSNKYQTAAEATLFNPMSKDDFTKQYEDVQPKYEDLRLNLEQTLKRLLKSEGQLFLAVTSRVKEAKSAYDKIIKYKIADPFNSMHDWCGLRIICYYYDDVDVIGKILEKEFDIVEHRDKRNLLEPNQFGYRSLHYILKIKDAWLQLPDYRGLGGFKIEVQIRTVLMHAWAEIEHKIQYKNTASVPAILRRKLYQLSAKFEEADEQFESIRKGLSEYEKSLLERAKTIDAFASEELNGPVLKAFVDIALPDDLVNKTGGVESNVLLFNEAGITMQDVVNAYNDAGDLLYIVRDFEKADQPQDKLSAQLAITALLDIASSKLENKWRSGLPPSQVQHPVWQPIAEARKILQERREKRNI